MVKNLMRLEGRLIRVSAAGGLELEGFADTYPSGYGLHEFGREEESIRLRGFQLFEEDILRIEELGVRRWYYKHFGKLTPDELYAIMKARWTCSWWSSAAPMPSWTAWTRMPSMSGWKTKTGWPPICGC